jgi:beta-phosphoglucomutase-like phosphatase (HAD superfamily)
MLSYNRSVNIHLCKVKESELQGLIFDCDGTLVDTMPAYWDSWTKLCTKYGLSLTQERFYSWAGTPVRDMIARYVKSNFNNFPYTPLLD